MDGAQDDRLVHVVPVDRADMGKPKLLEQGAADGHAQAFLGPPRASWKGSGSRLIAPFAATFGSWNGARPQARKIGRHRAYRRLIDISLSLRMTTAACQMAALFIAS